MYIVELIDGAQFKFDADAFMVTHETKLLYLTKTGDGPSRHVAVFSLSQITGMWAETSLKEFFPISTPKTEIEPRPTNKIPFVRYIGSSIHFTSPVAGVADLRIDLPSADLAVTYAEAINAMVDQR